MKLRNLAHGSAKILPLVLVMVFAVPTTAKAKFRVLYNFRDGNDGGKPVLFATLAIDKSGNLLGATRVGGDLKNQLCEGYGCGVAFELSPSGNGRWKEKVLYETTDPLTDGIFSSALAEDSDGNLYGCTDPWGSEAPMFQLRPGPGAQWSFNPIWPSGCSGFVGLILDNAGDLYGEFGNDFNGDVYKLTPTKSGHWKLTVLYGFPNGTKGAAPVGNLVFDKAGNLYGIAGSSTCNWTCGLVFKLSPTKSGPWNCTVVHRFNMTDGNFPNGLTMDSQGNLFGTTQAGGKYGYGVVFEIIP
jgi:uncharacterized repeat protein (TIGR03803 family)